MSRNAKPLNWLLAASLALNLGMLGAVAWQQWRPQAAPAPQHLTDILELSATQREQWATLEGPFLQDLDANWAQIRQHREALVQAIFTPTPDAVAIAREQTRIAELQNAQQQRVITQLLAEHALLDDAQRTRLRDLLLSHYSAEPTQEEQLHNK